MSNDQQGAGTIPAKRQSLILELLRENGVVQVNELSARFAVTEMTIRRDLEAMERQGLAERTHGGAVSTSRIRFEPPISQKSALCQAEKEAIGKLAASLIENDDTVFVNSGTTTLQFLHALSVPRVKIVTNNPWAPIEMLSHEGELIMTGGELRRESFTLVGENASATVKQIFGTKAIIGVDGLSIKHGLTNPVQAEALLNRLMIEQTHGEVIVVADSTKIGRVSNFLTAPISDITILVTDDGLEPHYLEEFKRIGLKVLIAAVNRG
jgi:DeoR family fructose operon transcriptional repressor